MDSGPIRFAMQDGAMFTFTDAQVTYNAMGETGCRGSVTVTVE
jgi:hypothetical protein